MDRWTTATRAGVGGAGVRGCGGEGGGLAPSLAHSNSAHILTCVFCSKWRLLEDGGGRYTEQSDMKIVSEKSGADTSLRFVVRAHKVRSSPLSSSPFASRPPPPLLTSYCLHPGACERHLVARRCGHSDGGLGQVHKDVVAWYDARSRASCKTQSRDTVTRHSHETQSRDTVTRHSDETQ